MNEQELRTILRRLAGHLHHLQTELHDQPLHAPRYSQTDSRQSHGGPRPPCNLTDIDYLLDVGAEQIIKGWATNLTQDTTAHNLPHGQPLATWCAWLNRHRHTLLQMEWADDAVAELQELEQELRHHIHPPGQHPTIEHRQTATSIRRRLSNMGHTVTLDTIRGWARHGHITAIKQTNGHNGYLLTEVLNHITKETK